MLLVTLYPKKIELRRRKQSPLVCACACACARKKTNTSTNDGYRVTSNGKENTVKEADLITAIKKYLATVPETFCWKEHGGQYDRRHPGYIVGRGHFIALEAKVGKNQPTSCRR